MKTLHPALPNSSSCCSNNHGCGRNKKLPIGRLAVLLLALGMTAAQGIESNGTVTLEWDANPETDVAGYKLYYGTVSGTVSGTYARIIDAGNATFVDVPDMISNFTYYFVVKAYNSQGVESPPSNEVAYTVPPPSTLSIQYLPRLNLPVILPAVPEIRTVQAAPGVAFSFTIVGASGSVVTVSASLDLTTWEPLGTITNPTGGIKVSDTETPKYPHRYYRVKQVDTTGLAVPD